VAKQTAPAEEQTAPAEELDGAAYQKEYTLTELLAAQQPAE